MRELVVFHRVTKTTKIRVPDYVEEDYVDIVKKHGFDWEDAILVTDQDGEILLDLNCGTQLVQKIIKKENAEMVETNDFIRIKELGNKFIEDLTMMERSNNEVIENIKNTLATVGLSNSRLEEGLIADVENHYHQELLDLLETFKYEIEKEWRSI